MSLSSSSCAAASESSSSSSSSSSTNTNKKRKRMVHDATSLTSKALASEANYTEVWIGNQLIISPPNDLTWKVALRPERFWHNAYAYGKWRRDVQWQHLDLSSNLANSFSMQRIADQKWDHMALEHLAMTVEQFYPIADLGQCAIKQSNKYTRKRGGLTGSHTSYGSDFNAWNVFSSECSIYTFGRFLQQLWFTNFQFVDEATSPGSWHCILRALWKQYPDLVIVHKRNVEFDEKRTNTIVIGWFILPGSVSNLSSDSSLFQLPRDYQRPVALFGKKTYNYVGPRWTQGESSTVAVEDTAQRQQAIFSRYLWDIAGVLAAAAREHILFILGTVTPLLADNADISNLVLEYCSMSEYLVECGL